MWCKFLIGIRNGLTGLLLGGTMCVGTSTVAADYYTSSSDGSSVTRQPVSQESTEDPALLLASRTVILSPTTQEEEKKTPWWSVFSFSSKKESESSTLDMVTDTPSTGKFKSSKASSKNTPMLGSKKSMDTPDSGQTEVTANTKEKQYSEVDYIASAVEPKDTKARSLYNEGLLAESQGRHSEAIQAYNGFIKANEQSTKNGVLAAPYHRLALISWKDGNVPDTGIYFRYALNYALGGNLLIIGGDYAQFLMAKGDYAKAEVILRNALINDPENKRLLLYLGRCVALQKKHQESLRYLVAAVGRAQAYEELAAVYRQQGEFELARVAAEKRNEFLASNRPLPPAPPAGYSMGAMTQQAMTPSPTAAYPPNSAAAARQQIPYPTPERLPNPYEASSGWGPVQQLSTVPQPIAQPVSAATPVSKVFHYPPNSPSPVYYQYTGDEYPQSATPHPWAQTPPEGLPTTGAQTPCRFQ